jgi:hypothetical protein
MYVFENLFLYFFLPSFLKKFHIFITCVSISVFICRHIYVTTFSLHMYMCYTCLPEETLWFEDEQRTWTRTLLCWSNAPVNYLDVGVKFPKGYRVVKTEADLMFCLWLSVIKFMELVAWRVLQRTSLAELHCSETTALQVLFINLAHVVALQLNWTVGVAVALRFKCPGSGFLSLSSVFRGKGSLFAHRKVLRFRGHYIPIHLCVILYKLCPGINILN